MDNRDKTSKGLKTKGVILHVQTVVEKVLISQCGGKWFKNTKKIFP